MREEFTIERINEVFNNFNTATSELLFVMKSLSAQSLGTPETWVTVTQAAARSGISKRTIQGWAAKNKIKVRRIGNIYEVVYEDIIRFASHRSAV